MVQETRIGPGQRGTHEPGGLAGPAAASKLGSAGLLVPACGAQSTAFKTWLAILVGAVHRAERHPVGGRRVTPIGIRPPAALRSAAGERRRWAWSHRPTAGTVRVRMVSGRATTEEYRSSRRPAREPGLDPMRARRARDGHFALPQGAECEPPRSPANSRPITRSGHRAIGRRYPAAAGRRAGQVASSRPTPIRSRR